MFIRFVLSIRVDPWDSWPVSLFRGDSQLLLIFLVGPLVIGDTEIGGAAFEVPDARASFFNEVFVVGDEEDGAIILLNCLIEGVDGFEVKVVGGFVEDEDVGLLEHDLAEEKAGRLAAGERVSFFEAFFATEEHLAEDAANVFLGGFRVEGMEPLGYCSAFGDGAGVILREVAD